MADPDPRPLIAACLTTEFCSWLRRNGRAHTARLLDEYIPEGAPWAADWHDPDPVTGHYLTIRAGAVTRWLEAHPDAS
jgi:hypothetical protein